VVPSLDDAMQFGTNSTDIFAEIHMRIMQLGISKFWPMPGIPIPIENVYYYFSVGRSSTVAAAVVRVSEATLLTLAIKHLNTYFTKAHFRSIN